MDGLYIAIEGVEGAGKSTQAGLLHERLPNSVVTKEPGGTEIGAGLRALLLHGTVDIDPRTEALLMTADRLENYLHNVEPELAAGRHVITDRSFLSMVAYQAYGRDLGMILINKLYDIAWTQMPDIAVLIDIDTEVAMERTQWKSPDRFEQLGERFFGRVRVGFDECARRYTREVVRVDGHGTISEVSDRVYAAVTGHSAWELWADFQDEPPHPQPLTHVLRDGLD
jgi:dTMP kinase